MAIVPLPNAISKALGSNTHPSLALDKYLKSWVQEGGEAKFQELVQRPTLEEVSRLSAYPPDGLVYSDLLARQEKALGRLYGTITWKCRSSGPLTLHLSRASALENAGICLHPLYGFAYLPGSGLKGLVRAFAETIWLPAQPDQVKARDIILEVFGNAPRKRPQHAGMVIFHDAWPNSWPKLVVDILNNHHSKYYQGKDMDGPGDWENPIPVYFLAVEPGTVFRISLSWRQPNVSIELQEQVKAWLLGGLAHLGVGAKTNSGYGTLIATNEQVPSIESPSRASCQVKVELVSPAFLAGAAQQRDDCDLRPATLRGLLRWWWRTMHAGALTTRQLLELEDVLWGNTQAGSAIRLTVKSVNASSPELYSYKNGRSIKPRFAITHELQPPPEKTSQGLFYASYGMDDGRPSRWYLPLGASWEIVFLARPHKDNDGFVYITAQQVLEQAKLALWLLSHFGGVRAKGRKGFGSLTVIKGLEGLSLEKCQNHAEAFRRDLLLTKGSGIDSKSFSLASAITWEVQTPWINCWFVLDQLGCSYQCFAQQWAHRQEKVSLGLPRKIHGPNNKPFTNQYGGTHLPPKWLSSPKGARFASPALFHLDRCKNGKLIVRMIACPSPLLPDLSTSRKILSELKNHLQIDFNKRIDQYGSLGQATASVELRSPFCTGPAHTIPGLPKSKDLVEAELLPEKTKNNGWRATHLRSGISGPIQNSADVPNDKKPGERLLLIVQSANNRQIDFRWPIEAERVAADKQITYDTGNRQKREPIGKGKGNIKKK